jgi:PPK2 family polyphosphate:nucleotide phosphotransferase
VARREILDRIQKYVDPFRITKGKGFRLKDFDPGDTRGLKLDKGEAAELLQRGTEWLAEEQNMLYAQDSWSLLLVFQAMDAAGKDGTIKHVMSGVNPQGCQVFSFKQPSREDLDHDFMWRYVRCLPERGRIGIFNRSYYEEVLVVRVHPEILRRQRLPPQSVGKRIWDERLADIAHFEDYLMRQGTILLKFFLHVSREEQKRRFMQRLDKPRKHWKFSSADIRERGFWGDYMHAFEEATPRQRPTRRGSLCRPTTSGSPGLSSPQRSWKRWKTSTSATRRSMQPRRKSSPRRGRGLLGSSALTYAE